MRVLLSCSCPDGTSEGPLIASSLAVLERLLNHIVTRPALMAGMVRGGRGNERVIAALFAPAYLHGLGHTVSVLLSILRRSSYSISSRLSATCSLLHLVESDSRALIAPSLSAILPGLVSGLMKTLIDDAQANAILAVKILQVDVPLHDAIHPPSRLDNREGDCVHVERRGLHRRGRSELQRGK